MRYQDRQSRRDRPAIASQFNAKDKVKCANAHLLLDHFDRCDGMWVGGSV